MFDRYRRILSLPGALRFSGSALVGRLPMAMVTIGIVLLATNAGRSYGLAGASQRRGCTPPQRSDRAAVTDRKMVTTAADASTGSATVAT